MEDGRPHWIRLTVCVAALAGSMLNWWPMISVAFNPEGSGRGLSPFGWLLVMQCAGIILSAFLPSVGGAALLAVSAADLFDPMRIGYQWLGLGAYCSLAILGYERRPAWSASAACGFAAISVIDIALHHDVLSVNVPGIMLIIATYAVAAIIGMGFRWRRIAQDAQREVLETKRLRRDLELARAIHDSVTGDLSYIAMVGESRLDDDPAWRTVHERAIHGLTGIRNIVRALDDSAPSASSMLQSRDRSATASFAKQFRESLDAHQRRMEQLGLHGSVGIRGEIPDLAAPDRRLLTGFVDELFANMVRHADLSEGNPGYALDIVFGDGRITITQVNAIRRQDDADHNLAAGHGLVHYRNAITDGGGSINISAENGCWVLHAAIAQH